MTAWLVRWRLAMRIARRDALRAKGRTVLVLLMVGLPVLAIVGGDTLFRTSQVSAAETLPATLGAADAMIEGVSRTQVWANPSTGDLIQWDGEAGAPWSAAEVLDRLPAGSRLAEVQAGRIAFATDAGYATVDGYADDLTDPLRQGAVEVIDGRVPTADGEVAISRSVARRGIALGDELALTRDDVPATVVGVLAADARRGARFLVVAPEAAGLLSRASTEFYAAVPGGLNWPAVRELNEQGLVVVSSDVVVDPPAEAESDPRGYTTGSAPV